MKRLCFLIFFLALLNCSGPNDYQFVIRALDRFKSVEKLDQQELDTLSAQVGREIPSKYRGLFVPIVDQIISRAQSAQFANINCVKQLAVEQMQLEVLRLQKMVEPIIKKKQPMEIRLPRVCETGINSQKTHLYWHGFNLDIKGIELKSNTSQIADKHYSVVSPYVISLDITAKGFSVTEQQRIGLVHNLFDSNESQYNIDLSPPIKNFQFQPVAHGELGGGYPFSDNISNSEKLTKIVIGYGEFLNNIESFQGDLSMGSHGGSQKNNVFELELESGESIRQIDVKYGHWLDQIRFITNKSRDTGYIGGSQGGITKQYIVPDGYEIVGFSGRAGSYVDALDVILRKID